jgi:hypothetical protein
MKAIIFIAFFYSLAAVCQGQNLIPDSIRWRIITSPRVESKSAGQVYISNSYSRLKPFQNLNPFDGQSLSRYYRPTYSTNGMVSELGVTNGERNLSGVGRSSTRIPFYMYVRKYDAFFEFREKQKGN